MMPLTLVKVKMMHLKATVGSIDAAFAYVAANGERNVLERNGVLEDLIWEANGGANGDELILEAFLE